MFEGRALLARRVLYTAACSIVVTDSICPKAEYQEIRLIRAPEQSGERREDYRHRRRVFLTPIIDSDGSLVNYSHGYLGLNNQREVLQNLLLAAERLHADILLPPVVLGTSFDPKPVDLIRTGACKSTSYAHDGRFDAPFNLTWVSSGNGILFGPSSVVWDTKRYSAFAYNFFGAISVVESEVLPGMDCVNYDDGFRHVLLDTRTDSDPSRSQENPSAQYFINRIESWRQAMLQDEATETTVYHVILGFPVFSGALNRKKCSIAFGEVLCQAALQATAFSNHIKSRAREIVSAMHAISAEGRFDVAHYHDWFCAARNDIALRMEKSSNQTVVYNIGDPPNGVRGVRRHDIRPGWCGRLPFQVNAAIEFQVSLEATGTFVGTSVSSFDRYLDAYRSLTQRKTEIIYVSKSVTTASDRTPLQSGGRCPEPIFQTEQGS